ncbi:MAG: hypothetical protein IJ091_06230 [Oscillospiraceae bacterium]|nr:hypothetical protein [Oscillospiraceae bacterium]
MIFRKVSAIVLIALMILTLSACGNKTDGPVGLPDTTDQMFSEKAYGVNLYLFQIDGSSYEIGSFYGVYVYDRDLEDGHFYKLTADVTYLNGGIAGYVDFPQLDRIIDCEEISPFDLDLPTIRDERYGLTLIGDYADGDLFLNWAGHRALWKDGEWIWQYDKETKREDGTLVCYRKDVSQEDIEEGIGRGILACPEYFVQPAI